MVGEDFGQGERSLPMQKRLISLRSFIPFVAGAAVCAFISDACAGPIVNDFSSLPAANNFTPAGYQSRDMFYGRHSKEMQDQAVSLRSEEVAALIVLFLPWTEANPVPPPPDGNGGNGGNGPTGGNGGDGNGGNGQGPGDPGGDPNGGGGHTVQTSPEPTSMLSGALGAGMVALFGWRRRRRTMNP
jgi:MYXO-CTERM domain-containing protein